jgi:hypothetical protein
MTKHLNPLKGKPLRSPGQSVQDELDNLVFDHVAPYSLGAAFLVIQAFTEWLMTIQHAPRQPWVYTLLAVVAVAASAVQIPRALKKSKQLKLGRDGERVVGQFLEGLRVDGARVFHDIPGEGFNLDHVVISPHGVYVVETKTRMKPRSASAQITCEGTELRIAGQRPDRDPIVQVQSGGRWLQKLLEETTGKKFAVRTAVVFPGWFVQPMPLMWRQDASMPWVLEPKALPAFIEQEPVSLGVSDVSLAAYHLSRYVRAKEADAALKK